MESNSFSLLGMLATMNWVARGVVVVLALMSIWSLTIAIERLLRFQRAKRESLSIALGVTPLLKQHKLEEAITMTSDKRYRHSHLARVLRAGLTEFQYETTQSLPDDFDIVAPERFVQKLGIFESYAYGGLEILGQLIEKGLVRGVKPLERRELHDCFHFAFKQDWQHHDIDWT